jgi:myo-inositol 2-dehydrogenase/D-chiro-inositol 1-dehydrogenase
MSDIRASVADPVRVGVIGVGRIGASHATLLAGEVPGARLAGIAGTRLAAAEALAQRLGCRAVGDVRTLLADDEVEAVVIAAPTAAHAELVVAAAEAGKAIFCEKPMGMTLAEIDRGIAAAEAAGVALQVGFNRRFSHDFAAAHRIVASGDLGTPQLMRSLTRDPGLADPSAVLPGAIFTHTLIHDFDTLLWLNPGADPVSVYAAADALVAPRFRSAGLLDTAVVVITFDNGAIAVAEASFSAAYGYDVRGEVFGSAGMVTMGGAASSSVAHLDASGLHVATARGDVELFRSAFVGEFAEFVDAVREGRPPSVTGHDARRAFRLALASLESVETGAPVRWS